MLWSYYYDGTADDLERKATSSANGFRMYTRSDDAPDFHLVL